MTTMLSVLIFAKQGDAVDALIALIIVVVAVVSLISAAIRGPARYDLTIKSGLPHCPRCNRQVSYRRDVCRACGYRFKTHGWSRSNTYVSRPTESDRAEMIRQDEMIRAVHAKRRAKRCDERQLAREGRRVARDAYYRGRGVEPGPLAWYRALPNWQQAIVLGVAMATPAVAVIAFLMR